MKTRGKVPAAVGSRDGTGLEAPPLVHGQASLQSLSKSASTDIEAGEPPRRNTAGEAPEVSQTQVFTTPIVPRDATRPAESRPRAVPSAQPTDPFLVGTPSAPSARRMAASPAGPTPKRPRRQPRTELDPIGETSLQPADVDRYLWEASRGEPATDIGRDPAYMRPNISQAQHANPAGLAQQVAPLSHQPEQPQGVRPASRSRRRSSSVDTFRGASPGHIPSPFAHAEDRHALTMFDHQLVRILQLYGLNVSRQGE
ncbi:hypothetical protein C0992_007175 [Termitomyces sp. T32_za158]|nr:hypothetical protein C0992_007175 [Termitomyces sp. T32_za158]